MTSESATAPSCCPAAPSATARVAAAGAVVTKDVPAYTIVAGTRRGRSGGGSRRHRQPAGPHWRGGTVGRRELRGALPDFRKLDIEEFSRNTKQAAPPVARQ